MLTRILLWALLLFVVFRTIGRLIRGIGEGARGTTTRRGHGPGAASPKGELMVRDPVCGTFVVPSRALSYRDKNGPQCFCSDTCRQAYVSRAERG
jgi:YHS domain-containing protein